MCGSSEFNIPKQNKGVCNNCDVAIWVHNPSGMNLKWCKGSKNFKKWIDFGVKVCVMCGSSEFNFRTICAYDVHKFASPLINLFSNIHLISLSSFEHPGLLI